MLLQRVHLRACLACRDARAQAGNARHVVDGAVGGEQGAAAPERRVDIGMLDIEPELPFEHAHNRIVHIVQGDYSADRRSAAPESLAPQAMADHRRRHSSGAIFLGQDCAPQRHLHVEGAEEAGRDLQAVDSFRRAGTGQIVPLRCERRYLPEGVRVSLPIEKVGV